MVTTPTIPVRGDSLAEYATEITGHDANGDDNGALAKVAETISSGIAFDPSESRVSIDWASIILMLVVVIVIGLVKSCCGFVLGFIVECLFVSCSVQEDDPAYGHLHDWLVSDNSWYNRYETEIQSSQRDFHPSNPPSMRLLRVPLPSRTYLLRDEWRWVTMRVDEDQTCAGKKTIQLRVLSRDPLVIIDLVNKLQGNDPVLVVGSCV